HGASSGGRAPRRSASESRRAAYSTCAAAARSKPWRSAIFARARAVRMLRYEAKSLTRRAFARRAAPPTPLSMSMLKQRTLKAAVKSTGVGLHTGARVDMTMRPAPIDTGIVFHRVDLPTPVDIPTHAMHVGDTRLSSTLQKDGARI